MHAIITIQRIPARLSSFFLTITEQQFLVPLTILLGFCCSVRVFVNFTVLFTVPFDFDLRVVVSLR